MMVRGCLPPFGLQKHQRWRGKTISHPARAWLKVWLFAVGVILHAALLPPQACRAEDAGATKPTIVQLEAKIAAVRSDLSALAGEVESNRTDFEVLLGSRKKADALVERAERVASDINDVDLLLGDDTKKALANSIGTVLRNAENLRKQITDFRRRQMTERIFAPSLSPLSPAFWSDIFSQSVPTTREQLEELVALWTAHSEDDLLADTAIMAFAVVALVLATMAVRRAVMARLLGSTLAFWHAEHSRRSVMLRALVSLILSSLPVPIALAILAIIDRQIEFAPEELDAFFKVAIFAWAGVSLSECTLKLALQPRRPELRLIAVRDDQAELLYRSGLILLMTYGIALALNEFMGALHFLVALSAALTMVWVCACGVCISWTLVRFHRPPATVATVTEGGLASGRAVVKQPVSASGPLVAAIEICSWTVVGAATLGVLAGYLAFAGFVMGRFLVTAVLWVLAYLLLKIIDELLAPKSRVTAAQTILSKVATPSAETNDLIMILAAGVLRVAVLLPLLFITLGPWHLEYGDINPFQDVFIGINLAQIRDELGSESFSIVCLIIGLIGTKMLTSWLNASLLPHTKLEPGIRYSVTTIVGYGGTMLSIILALAQLGISPQSLTVIASALSVGVGFGLQSVVSNFVSGLIVLTERRVRIGDIVSVKGEEGLVRQINIRSTLITSSDNVDLIVPNTDLISSIVRNKSSGNLHSLLKLPLVVRLDTDLGALFDIVMSVTYHHENVQTEPAPTLVLVKPGLEGLEFEVTCLLVDGSRAAATRSELFMHWLDLFRRQGIALEQAAG